MLSTLTETPWAPRAGVLECVHTIKVKQLFWTKVEKYKPHHPSHWGVSWPFLAQCHTECKTASNQCAKRPNWALWLTERIVLIRAVYKYEQWIIKMLEGEKQHFLGYTIYPVLRKCMNCIFQCYIREREQFKLNQFTRLNQTFQLLWERESFRNHFT